jgi:hypothetical protein
MAFFVAIQFFIHIFDNLCAITNFFNFISIFIPECLDSMLKFSSPWLSFQCQNFSSRIYFIRLQAMFTCSDLKWEQLNTKPKRNHQHYKHTTKHEHKRVYTLESHSLVQQFSTTIFEAPDDDHAGRHMYCTSDVKIHFQIKKNVNLKILTQDCRWDSE